jgi:hypothetical protein
MNKIKCTYRGHNENYAAVTRPDGKSYDVPIPQDVKDKKREWFDWMYPVEDALTKQYYREKAFDELENIKRDQGTAIMGFTFCYDLFDDVVSVYDIRHGAMSSYSDIKKLFNLEDPSTKEKIISAIELNQKIKIKSIQYSDYEWNRATIKCLDLGI